MDEKQVINFIPNTFNIGTKRHLLFISGHLNFIPNTFNIGTKLVNSSFNVCPYFIPNAFNLDTKPQIRLFLFVLYYLS